MTQQEIKRVFRKVYKGKCNIMSSEIINYQETDDYLIELSRGPGIITQDIFGVTVIYKSLEEISELSTSFQTRAQADNYIKGLK